MTTPIDLKTIGLWVVIWLIGYGLGLFEAWYKGNRKEKKETRKEAKIVEKTIYMPAPDSEHDYILTLEEVDAGILQLQLDGETLDSPASMQSKHRKRLVDLLIALRPWIDAQASPVQEKIPPKPVSMPSLSGASISAARPTPTTPEGMEIEKKHEEHVDEKLSMVAQIDKILQKNLEGHSLEKIGVRLQESLSGGVNFDIGETRYEFIDEIPDKNVQALIQSAIKEWESTSKPGL